MCAQIEFVWEKFFYLNIFSEWYIHINFNSVNSQVHFNKNGHMHMHICTSMIETGCQSSEWMYNVNINSETQHANE